MKAMNNRVNEFDELEMLGTPENVKKLNDEQMSKVHGGLSNTANLPELDIIDIGGEDETPAPETTVGRRGKGGMIIR